MTSQAKRLAILVQFDPAGGFPEYIRLHIEGLRPVAERIVLVSNSPMDREARGRAESVADKVMLRDNVGWDFAGWRDALAEEDASAWGSVILTNSSVVGPLFPLEPIFETMDARDLDFWGMVLSHNKALHLQSYFLVVRSSILQSATWPEFWSKVGNLTNKRKVIKKYELGFTRHFYRAGFSYAPFMKNPRFPESIQMVYINALGPLIRIPFNVNFVNRTVESHLKLVEEGMPYLKSSLLWGKDRYRMKAMDRIVALTSSNYQWGRLSK